WTYYPIQLISQFVVLEWVLLFAGLKFAVITASALFAVFYIKILTAHDEIKVILLTFYVFQSKMLFKYSRKIKATSACRLRIVMSAFCADVFNWRFSASSFLILSVI